VTQGPAPPLLALGLNQLLDLLAEYIAERLREPAEPSEPVPGRSPWMNVESAAAYLDLPKQRLYRLTASGAIPHYKQEGRLLFRREELDGWLGGFAQAARR
jgi:excisionase family DNA binding protein